MGKEGERGGKGLKFQTNESWTGMGNGPGETRKEKDKRRTKGGQTELEGDSKGY